MTDQQAEPKTTVSITLDGAIVEAKPGELVIAAAERVGTYIPRFCYHPRMRPVGMCRMCLVEVEGPRGTALTPACYVPVAEGQVIHTTTPAVKKAQDGVLEFLLVNHPLDCPVCDKGGECPLQDQTLAFGPGETRFVEEKRHWEKPIALSSNVLIDRERCIQCDRCTRFADEVAGDTLIEFIGRGASTEINTFPDQPFSSYFSGNTVQICPVGALLAVPYRFKARPWDLEQVESTCTQCAFGCRVAVQSSRDDLTRYLGLDSDPVNHGWLCDKGRFSYEAVNSDDRLTQPLVREEEGELAPASWGDALAVAARGIDQARAAGGAGSVAVIGGARLANEDAYAWAKLAKGVLGTDNVDAQLADGLPAELVLGLPRATIDDACNAAAVILLSGDIKEELPVLYLRLRGAAVDHGLPVVELGPQLSGMSRYAKASLVYRPGEAAVLAGALVASSPSRDAAGVPASAIAAARALLAGAVDAGPDGRIVVVLGRPSVSESAASIAAAAEALATMGNVSFLSGLRRGNVHGALDMGLAPGMLPGRVTLDEGRAWFDQAWPTVPDQRGLDTTGILQAAADGSIDALVLLGADPLGDFPDRELARRALDRVAFTVAVDTFLTASSATADVVFPAAAFAERGGTTTNIEGRVTRLGQKINAPGLARPDWMIAVELADYLGADLGFTSTEEIWDEIAALAPSHEGVSAELLASRASRDGVVVPLGAAIPRGHDASVPDASADPASTPGLAHVESQGVADAQAEADGGSEAEAAQVGEGEAEAEVELAPPAASAASRPALVRYRGGADDVRAKALDSYSLRLVAGRKLYDAGVTAQQSPSLAGLSAAPVVRVHPHDLDRLGVTTGALVRARAPRLAATVEVRADASLPRGSAAADFNVPGLEVAQMLDSRAIVADIVLETLS